MTNITIKYSHSSKSKVTIEKIKVGNYIVDRLTNTPAGNLEEGKKYSFQKLEKLMKSIDDSHNVELEEVEEGSVYRGNNPDLLYAQGGHGCGSYDEFIERMNFPEDYE